MLSTWPSRTILLILKRVEASSSASLAYITCCLSGRTGSVVSRYDPPDSSSFSPGTSLREWSPSGQLVTTIGAWFMQLVLKGADAFPASLVSHPCVTPAPVFALRAGAPANSVPFLTTLSANAGGSVGCHSEGRAA